MPLNRGLYINQYESNLDPRTMEQGDFMQIEVSNSIYDPAYEKLVIRLAVLIPIVPLLRHPLGSEMSCLLLLHKI